MRLSTQPFNSQNHPILHDEREMQCIEEVAHARPFRTPETVSVVKLDRERAVEEMLAFDDVSFNSN